MRKCFTIIAQRPKEDILSFEENLVKTILPEFLTYLDKLEKGEIVEKKLDINKNPSIHCDVNELKGVENAISFRNR